MSDLYKGHDSIATCLFLCSKNDETIVNKMKEILSVHVRVKEPRSNDKTSIPKVTIMHVDNFNDVSPLLHGISIFIFFTKSFLSHAKYKLCESVLQQIYQDQERHCILIPVFKNGNDRSEQGIPAYLRSLESVVLDDILKNCTFDSIDDRSLSKSSFKKGVIRRFEQMFSKSYCTTDIQNMERISARQKMLKNENAFQCCKEMTNNVDTSNLQSQIIFDERNCSIENVLPTNIVIINSEPPKNEVFWNIFQNCQRWSEWTDFQVERSDDGCPLYILVDADDEGELLIFCNLLSRIHSFVTSGISCLTNLIKCSAYEQGGYNQLLS